MFSTVKVMKEKVILSRTGAQVILNEPENRLCLTVQVISLSEIMGFMNRGSWNPTQKTS